MLLTFCELILGIPPMSQYDAAATPMYDAFQPSVVTTPFAHLEPRISLDEKNDQWAWGAEASGRMNLTEADLAPDHELNEIIWRSVKGPSAALPATVRSAFVRHRSGDADDDDHW